MTWFDPHDALVTRKGADQPLKQGVLRGTDGGVAGAGTAPCLRGPGRQKRMGKSRMIDGLRVIREHETQPVAMLINRWMHLPRRIESTEPANPLHRGLSHPVRSCHKAGCVVPLDGGETASFHRCFLERSVAVVELNQDEITGLYPRG